MNEKAERYLELAHKYLKDSEELIARADYIQASKKLWGATAKMVKTIAAKRGIELRTHGDLWKFVAVLRAELKDPESSKLFTLANYLHQNFYEGIMPPETVVDGAEAVKQFIVKLERLL